MIERDTAGEFALCAVRQDLQGNFSHVQIQRCDLHPFQPVRFRQDLQRDAAVDAAEAVEIVIGLKERIGRLGVEPVIHCNEQFMNIAAAGVDVGSYGNIGSEGAGNLDTVIEHASRQPQPADPQAERPVFRQIVKGKPVDSKAPLPVVIAAQIKNTGNGGFFGVFRHIARNKICQCYGIAQPRKIMEPVKIKDLALRIIRICFHVFSFQKVLFPVI